MSWFIYASLSRFFLLQDKDKCSMGEVERSGGGCHLGGALHFWDGQGKSAAKSNSSPGLNRD